MKLKSKYIIFLIFISLLNCNDKKWNVNNSNPPVYDIPNNAIFFQDSINGVFGGYGLKENPKSKNWDGIDMFPIIYKTKTLGKEFQKINIPKEINGNVHKIYLKDSTIITQIDDSIFKTNNLGESWKKIFSGFIETYNINFIDKNNLLLIVRGYKNKFLVEYKNEKIDTLQRLEFNTDYQITKSKVFNWKRDKENNKSKTIIFSDNYSSKKDSISFAQPEEINYVFELEPNKIVIITKNKIYKLYDGKLEQNRPNFYEKYYIKDFLADKNILISICKEKNNKNSMTDDYYFISKDYGKNWKLLQVEKGSNRKKFLLENKMLISFESGLEYINL